MDRPEYSEQLKVFSNLFEAFKGIKLDWKSKYAGFERILYDSKLVDHWTIICLLYTSPSPRDQRGSRMPSSA